MGSIEMGFLISLSLAGLLLLLFRYEARRGVRVLEYVRTRLDFIVLEVTHRVHTVTHVFLKHVVKQWGHYVVHSFLAGMLILLRSFERSVSHVMRVNKRRAQKAERNSDERNKLEEIALHKLQVALSEEEKLQRKKDHLEGK